MTRELGLALLTNNTPPPLRCCSSLREYYYDCVRWNSTPPPRMNAARTSYRTQRRLAWRNHDDAHGAATAAVPFRRSSHTPAACWSRLPARRKSCASGVCVRPARSLQGLTYWWTSETLGERERSQRAICSVSTASWRSSLMPRVMQFRHRHRLAWLQARAARPPRTRTRRRGHWPLHARRALSAAGPETPAATSRSGRSGGSSRPRQR